VTNNRILWITDIHLDFLSESEINRFIEKLQNEAPDALLIGGDISVAPKLPVFLKKIEGSIDSKIYFVLGNHDFYHGSIIGVRSKIRDLTEHSDNLIFLDDNQPVNITKDTTLVGHGCWADGRYGDYGSSDVMLNDYLLIDELKDLSKSQRLAKLHELGDEAADRLRHNLNLAFNNNKNVLCLTHVPPFREACQYQGRIAEDNFLPHFSCKAVGDIMLEVMHTRTDSNLTVLSGHTHNSSRAKIMDNLIVITGGAEYGKPVIQDRIVIP
jgi:Icc-related predicted phosphoesterase